MSTLDYELSMLEKEKTNEDNKRAIREFVNELRLEGLTDIRRLNYVQRLRLVARWIPNSFLSPQKQDIRKVILRLSGSYEIEFKRKKGEKKGTTSKVIRREYSEYTKATYLDMMKKFYQWKIGKSAPVDLFDGIKVNKRKLPKKTAEDMISPEEVDLLIKHSMNARDRAMFSVLYDSGCRIGELLKMKIESVKFDDYGAVLQVPKEGKTGFRNVRIVGNSIPYLRAWLDSHPDVNNNRAPLFCNIQRYPGRELNYGNIYAVIDRTLNRAKIEKRIHPHLFRHTRATILASKPLAGSVFEDQMGWIHGSRQTQTYVHLSGKEQDNAMLKAYGIEVKEDDAATEDRPVKCPRCGEPNASNSVRCRKCWIPLDVAVALEEKEKSTRVISALKESEDLISEDAKVLLDPENLKGLAKILLKLEKNGQLDRLIELARKEGK